MTEEVVLRRAQRVTSLAIITLVIIGQARQLSPHRGQKFFQLLTCDVRIVPESIDRLHVLAIFQGPHVRRIDFPYPSHPLLDLDGEG